MNNGGGGLAAAEKSQQCQSLCFFDDEVAPTWVHRGCELLRYLSPAVYTGR